MTPAVQPMAEPRTFTGARLVAANEDRMIAADLYYNELKNSGELDRRNHRAAEELQRQGGVL